MFGRNRYPDKSVNIETATSLLQNPNFSWPNRTGTCISAAWIETLYFAWTSPSWLKELWNNSMQLSGDSMVKLVVMAKDNPRESHWSLMVFYSYCSVRCCSSAMVVVTCNHMMLLCMMTSMVMLTTGVVILVIGVAVVVILLLRRLSLTVLLILHPSILKPYLHLSFCQV